MAGIGSTPALLVGTAVGGAAAAAFEPALEVPRQQAWNDAPNRIIEPGLLAALVAQGAVDLSTARSIAKRNGYDSPAFDPLVYLAQTVPGAAEAMHLWRLGFIGDDLFRHVLVKAGLDERYIDPIIKTKIEELLGLGDIAIAVVRGILPAPSYVPVPVPATGDKVPRYPQVDIDPEELAAKIGFSPEALQVMVGRSGLSMAPVMAAQALFRGIIGPDDYLIAIGEGDLRTEWADPVKEASRQIPTVGEMMEHSLRGFESLDSAKTNAKRHGTVEADAQLVYDNLGRAPGLHGVTTGLARGGNYDGTPQTIPEPYLSAVQRANIRPEWYDLEYHNRFTYPSGFQIKSEAPIMGETLTEQTLLEVGWKPELAKFFATHWANPTAAASTASSHASKAATQLWNTTHNSYKAGEIPQATAAANLTTLGVSDTEQAQVFGYWNAERDTIRKSLSATQIKKAYTSQTTNPATGAAWTLADAVARLLELGYDQADATTLLEE